ncbi:MAG: AraC family transcriptional regulator [Bacteroidales bacterium]|jgi:AraC-like DNA-binding protein|nr:AraC family transcriptional regulator [Bacteroidales bacterium]
MFVAAGLLNLLIAHFKTDLADISRILSELKLDGSILQNPTNKIDADVLGMYLDFIVKKTGDNRIGLKTGFLLPFVYTGSLYNIYNQSTTVREIFGNPEPFEPAANNIVNYTTKEEGDCFFFEITLNPEFEHRFPIASRHWLEMQYGVSLQYAYSFTGRYLYPIRAYSAYQKEGEKDMLEEFLYCPIEFYQDKLSLIFNKTVLDLPIITGSDSLYSVFKDYMNEIRNLDIGQNNMLSRSVRRNLMHNLSNTTLSLKYIAARFNMSERNIQRKLKEEGTSYQQILDTLRIELSRKYLKEKIPLVEIAFLLGFESQSAFNKFFRKHFQIKPGQFRKNGDGFNMFQPAKP